MAALPSVARFALPSLAVIALSGSTACRRPTSDAARIDAASSSSPSASSAGTAVDLPSGVERCGDFDCLAFAAPLDAFRWVLARQPRVLAIGEAHAQRGTEGIASSTKRFTETLLPELAGKASGLVLELWLGEPKCGKVVEVVREQQKPVTATQAKTNPNELVALGDRAYALGIHPYPLRPTCEDYAPIADAGADAVPRMLELIERLSEQRMKALLATRNADAGAGQLVVAYGGALHNDVRPPPGNESFSFGPAMVAATGGRYVELDLIVGDFVRAEEPWTALPWTKAYLAHPRTEKTLLYRTSDASFVLVFPRTR